MTHNEFSSTFSPQPQTSGLFQQSEVTSHLVALPMDLSVMAQDCWYSVEWLNTESTATISMNYR